jgi:Mlc titration factor MtfA (ptsG expression regulator)
MKAIDAPMFGFKKRRRQRVRRYPLTAEERAVLERNIPYLSRLTAEDRRELEGWVQVFLSEKTFEGCGGLQITDEIRLTIAAQACILLLRSDRDCFPGLYSVLVYPHAYVVTDSPVPGGLVSDGPQARLGQSWSRGSLIVSWDDTIGGAADVHDGHNVVFHEFAHQLDQVDGVSDGAPVLDNRRRYASWARVLGEAYADLTERIVRHKPHDIDTYGATNPAEFFAVVTEYFFEKPVRLRKRHPELYDELRRFYRRDAAALELGEPEKLGS